MRVRHRGDVVASPRRREFFSLLFSSFLRMCFAFLYRFVSMLFRPLFGADMLALIAVSGRFYARSLALQEDFRLWSRKIQNKFWFFALHALIL